MVPITKGQWCGTFIFSLFSAWANCDSRLWGHHFYVIAGHQFISCENVVCKMAAILFRQCYIHPRGFARSFDGTFGQTYILLHSPNQDDYRTVRYGTLNWLVYTLIGTRLSYNALTWPEGISTIFQRPLKATRNPNGRQMHAITAVLCKETVKQFIRLWVCRPKSRKKTLPDAGNILTSFYDGKRLLPAMFMQYTSGVTSRY